MSVEIKGINNILKRLDKLSHIESSKAVKSVAEDVQKAISGAANEFSENGDAIQAFEERKCGNSTYIDVGLKADSCDWDKAKSLWFQQWGFYDYGWNFKNVHPYISSNKQWFDEAIQAIEADVKKKLKEELRKQVKECWNEG